jgi:hypothetical protein
MLIGEFQIVCNFILFNQQLTLFFWLALIEQLSQSHRVAKVGKQVKTTILSSSIGAEMPGEL